MTTGRRAKRETNPILASIRRLFRIRPDGMTEEFGMDPAAKRRIIKSVEPPPVDNYHGKYVQRPQKSRRTDN